MGTGTRECRGWWESVAWGIRVIARDVRARVVVVGDGEDAGARRRHVRHVRVRRRRVVDGNRCARVPLVVGQFRVGRAEQRACMCARSRGDEEDALGASSLGVGVELSPHLCWVAVRVPVRAITESARA